MLRQLDNGIMRVDPGGDAMHIPGEHAGRVGDGLTPSQLQLARREVERMAAQLRRRDLQRDARPGGGLLKDHGQALALQGQAVMAAPGPEGLGTVQ